VRRTERGVTVSDAHGERHEFDEVILACNANHALEILEDATAAEREFLSATRYQTSEIVVHRDVSLLPRDESRWRHYKPAPHRRGRGLRDHGPLLAAAGALERSHPRDLPGAREDRSRIRGGGASPAARHPRGGSSPAHRH
jgi:hypothetical protein